MTLQDYIQAVNNSLVSAVTSFLPDLLPIFVSLLIILLGMVFARLLSFAWEEVARILDIEKILQKSSSYKDLLKTNPSSSATNILSQLIWWVVVIAFLIPALETAGFGQTTVILAEFSEFVPKLLTGILFLAFGLIIAYFVSLVLSALAQLLRLPAAAILVKAFAFVILIFSTFSALDSWGVNGETQRFLIIASLGALALATGLSGKEFVSEFIRKLKSLKLQ